MKRNDLLLIVSLLVIGFLSMFIISLKSTAENRKVAVIQINGQESYRIPINNSAEEKRVSFEFSNHKGFLDLKDGAVKMEEMDRKICPQKICSETGWIKNSYETIICLPNKLVVSLENSESLETNEKAIDDVSF